MKNARKNLGIFWVYSVIYFVRQKHAKAPARAMTAVAPKSPIFKSDLSDLMMKKIRYPVNANNNTPVRIEITLLMRTPRTK